MKKYRTVSCVIIMAIAAIAGFFIGATLDEAMGGAILFSMIAGIAFLLLKSLYIHLHIYKVLPIHLLL